MRLLDCCCSVQLGLADSLNIALTAGSLTIEYTEDRDSLGRCKKLCMHRTPCFNICFIRTQCDNGDETKETMRISSSPLILMNTHLKNLHWLLLLKYYHSEVTLIY